ncbi:hypothetical protein IR073_06485 [Gemella sp. 19428wG2_WT2a]|nr:hypothetical protein [Gemella sp. 19428wG2_WT2a]TFU57683.1 hypothetical protein E4T67_06410 [Gemella sp. WT2a]
MAKIHWQGMEILSGVIKKANSRSEEEVSMVVKDTTSELNEKIQSKAPVDTATLKKGVTSRFVGKLESHTKSKVDYQGYQEYGTRFQSGKPHVRPALKEVEPKFKSDLTKVMKGLFGK